PRPPLFPYPTLFRSPDPHPPVIKNPALPMPATLDADPALFPPDTRQLNYGDPKSKSTTPSSGPGSGNGIGSGNGGGVGPGSGGRSEEHTSELQSPYD